MRRKILPLILGSALSVAAIAPAAAAHTPALGRPTLSGLVNVLVQDIDVVVFLNDTLNDNEILTVDINDSFNNILRNADIDVLNDLLRDADIDVTITDIQVVRGDVIINLLSGGVLVLQ